MRARKTYRLDIAQTMPPTPGQPDKEPMVIPLALGLVGKDGGDLPLTLDGRPLERGVHRADASRARASCSPASPSGRSLRSIAAFRRRSSSRCRSSPSDLRFLAAHDSDPFNRWQAVQTLAMTLLTDNVAALRGGAAGACRRRA